MQRESQAVQSGSSAQSQTPTKPSDQPRSILFPQPTPVNEPATSSTRSQSQAEASSTPPATADHSEGSKPFNGPFSLFGSGVKPTTQAQGKDWTPDQHWYLYRDFNFASWLTAKPSFFRIGQHETTWIFF